MVLTMKKKTGLLSYFSAAEIILWCTSVILILAAFALFDGKNLLNLLASLVGVTSLIFNAKGNPVGQVLMVLFSLMYGVISWRFRYYGEMVTYLGMTMPMAVAALVSWLRNPFRGNKAEVKVNRLSGGETLFALILSLLVSVVFYFILAYFHTPHLLPSTLSVYTSFLAVYLTFRRSPWFTVAYAANDVVLILLWILASGSDSSFLSVVVCFVAFLFNDLYGFISWRRMQRRQEAT